MLITIWCHLIRQWLMDTHMLLITCESHVDSPTFTTCVLHVVVVFLSLFVWHSCDRCSTPCCCIQAALVRDNNAIKELLGDGSDPLAFPNTPAGNTARATTAAAVKTAPQLWRNRGIVANSLHRPPASPTSLAIRRLSPRRRQELLDCAEMTALTPLDVSMVACDTFGLFKHKVGLCVCTLQSQMRRWVDTTTLCRPFQN